MRYPQAAGYDPHTLPALMFWPKYLFEFVRGRISSHADGLANSAPSAIPAVNRKWSRSTGICSFAGIISIVRSVDAASRNHIA